MQPVQSPPSSVPVESTPYHHFLRTPRHRWWKPIVLIVGILVSYAVLTVGLSGVAMAIDLATGASRALVTGELIMTPLLFLATNLGLALLAPAAMLLQWLVYGQRPRWMSSVMGRFRWGLMGRFALVLVPIYVLYVGGLMLITGLPTEPPRPEGLIFVVLIVLTTPFQSAGEEYAVRGLLTRAVAAWIPMRLVALVVASVLSAIVFTAGHTNLTTWRLVGYLVIALGFSLLVWRTGGLEAAVLGHALNNVLVLLPTALWGDLTAALLGVAGESGPWDLMPLLVVGLVSWGGVELVHRFSPYARVSSPEPMLTQESVTPAAESTPMPVTGQSPPR